MKWFYAIVTVLIVVLILWRTVKSVVSGKSCCGAGNKVPERVTVKHGSREEYPFSYVLNVEGMICSACVRNVENALNKQEGTWAKADLQKKEVSVMTKVQQDRKFFVDALADSTYTITGFKEVRNIEES